MDAGSDDTRAKRKQFAVFLCLPMTGALLTLGATLVRSRSWAPSGKHGYL